MAAKCVALFLAAALAVAGNCSLCQPAPQVKASGDHSCCPTKDKPDPRQAEQHDACGFCAAIPKAMDLNKDPGARVDLFPPAGLQPELPVIHSSAPVVGSPPLFSASSSRLSLLSVFRI